MSARARSSAGMDNAQHIYAVFGGVKTSVSCVCFPTIQGLALPPGGLMDMNATPGTAPLHR